MTPIVAISHLYRTSDVLNVYVPRGIRIHVSNVYEFAISPAVNAPSLRVCYNLGRDFVPPLQIGEKSPSFDENLSRICTTLQIGDVQHYKSGRNHQVFIKTCQDMHNTTNRGCLWYDSGYRYVWRGDARCRHAEMGLRFGGKRSTHRHRQAWPMMASCPRRCHGRLHSPPMPWHRVTRRHIL